jgi:rsbT antagonist protein RsbS
MGASVIITGLSPEIAQTLVTIGVDLSKMNTIGDLQGGLERPNDCSDMPRSDRKDLVRHEHRPALVSILRQGSFLIASIHTALDDTQMVRFKDDLVAQIGEHRSRGIIIDVAALDVLDSFGSRTLRNIAEMARLGAPRPSSSESNRTSLSPWSARHGYRTDRNSSRSREGLAYLNSRAGLSVADHRTRMPAGR